MTSTRSQAKPKSLQDVFQQIWLGAYPRVNTQGTGVRDLFYRSYVQTYIQRDVQDLIRITDQMAFNRFLAATAARTGQLLNYSSLARDADIDNKTALESGLVMTASDRRDPRPHDLP